MKFLIYNSNFSLYMFFSSKRYELFLLRYSFTCIQNYLICQNKKHLSNIDPLLHYFHDLILCCDVDTFRRALIFLDVLHTIFCSFLLFLQAHINLLFVNSQSYVTVPLHTFNNLQYVQNASMVVL